MAVPQFVNFVLEHFAVDPAATPINATGQQLVKLCRFLCADKGAQIPEPIMSSKCCLRISAYLTVLLSHDVLLFAKLDDMFSRLDRIQQES